MFFTEPGDHVYQDSIKNLHIIKNTSCCTFGLASIFSEKLEI